MPPEAVPKNGLQVGVGERRGQVPGGTVHQDYRIFDHLAHDRMRLKASWTSSYLPASRRPRALAISSPRSVQFEISS